MAKQTILQIVRAVAPRLGLLPPSTVTGSTDLQIQQLLALANEEGEELAGRKTGWTALIKERTFTTVAAESQGVLAGGVVPAGSGFSYILNDTIFNRTTQFGVSGPMTPRGWQGLKATTTLTGFYSQYRIRGGELLLYPAPAAGDTAAFEYVTENWVSNVTNDVFRTEFTMDDDYPLLDSRLIRLGLIWRWKSAKGLEYAENFNAYEAAVADALARDGTAGPASLDGCNRDGIEPGIFVSKGNWMQ